MQCSGDSAWAVGQIAVYEKCVDASFVPCCELAFPFCELAFQVGRGLVPHQPCFGVLTVGTRDLTRSPRLCPPEAGKAEGIGSWDVLVRQNASVGGKPRTDGREAEPRNQIQVSKKCWIFGLICVGSLEIVSSRFLHLERRVVYRNNGFIPPEKNRIWELRSIPREILVDADRHLRRVNLEIQT